MGRRSCQPNPTPQTGTKISAAMQRGRRRGAFSPVESSRASCVGPEHLALLGCRFGTDLTRRCVRIAGVQGA